MTGSTKESTPEATPEPTRSGTETPSDINIAMKCVLKSNVERFVKCFEDDEDPFRETVTDMICERDESGRNPLDMASILGIVGMTKELVARGAEVNEATSTGYTALHYAAAWGKIECVKALVDLGADIDLKTKYGERPKEVAVRYNQTECVDYLDWSEAKNDLKKAILEMRETSEQGRLSREDKKVAETICLEKERWLEVTTDATTQDYINMKIEFKEACAPLWEKIASPVSAKRDKKDKDKSEKSLDRSKSPEKFSPKKRKGSPEKKRGK